LNKIAKIFVFLAGSISILIALVFFLQEISTFIIWKSSGIINTDFVLQQDSTVIIGDIDSSDFESPPAVARLR
jgi:hypothetical protein